MSGKRTSSRTSLTGLSSWCQSLPPKAQRLSAFPASRLDPIDNRLVPHAVIGDGACSTPGTDGSPAGGRFNQVAESDDSDWVDAYVQQAGVNPPLDGIRISDLAASAQNGDEVARKELFDTSRRLVVRVAKQYVRPTAGTGLSAESVVRLGKLIRMGEGGLGDAILRFRPSKGFSFSTYAMWWIRQAITKGLGDEGGGSSSREPRSPLPSSGSTSGTAG